MSSGSRATTRTTRPTATAGWAPTPTSRTVSNTSRWCGARTRGLPVEGLCQGATGGLRALVRDIRRAAFPVGRIGGFVPDIAAVVLGGEQLEEVGPAYDSLSGRQPVSRRRAVGRCIRHVAVLHVENFRVRHFLEAAAGPAAALEMVGVEEQSDVLLAGARDEIAQDVEAAHNRVLELVFECKPQTEARCDLARPPYVGHCLVQACGARPDRAHRQAATERHRVLAGLPQRREQALPLVGGGKDPAIFHTDGAHLQA